MVDKHANVFELLVEARRRWRSVLLVTLISLAIGVVVALMPASYHYRTVLEIGRLADTPLDSNETVVSKINEAFLPQAVNEFATKIAGRHSPKIVAKSPRNSVLVVLSSEGGLEEEPIQLAFHQNIVNQLLEDHKGTLARSSAGLREALVRAHGALDQLLDDRRRLNSMTASETMGQGSVREPKLAKKDSSTDASLDPLDAASGASKTDASEGLFHGAFATSVRQDNLEDAITDNLRVSALTEETLRKLENELATIRETRVIIGPVRSALPSGFDWKQTVLIAASVGLILGCILAYLPAALQIRGVAKEP